MAKYNNGILPNTQDEEVKERELNRGFITYRTLADRVGDMVLCNNIVSLELEYMSGEIPDNPDIFQYYLISTYGAEFLQNFTNELTFYVPDLGVCIWAIAHFGTSWDYVFTEVPVLKN